MLPNILSLNFLVPFVAGKIDFSRSYRGLRGMPRRLLLIGHKLAAGNAVVNTIRQVTTETDALALYGEGSMLVAMWRAAKANADLGLPIDCIAAAPAGGAAAATTTIVITNTGANLAQAGEVMVYVEGERVYFGVTTADTVATVAVKLIAAVNAVSKLPVTAAATANPNEVRFTARTPGLTGNLIDLRSSYYDEDQLPAGLTLTIPAMSGGTTSPDLAPVVAAMQAYRATEIATAFTDSVGMGVLEAEAARRWDAANMQDGQIVNTIRGTENEVITYLGGRNSEQVHTNAVTKDLTSPWVTSAMAGAAMESMAAIDPLVPYTGAELVGYKGPRSGDHWTFPDQSNAMLLAGGSPLKPDASGKFYLNRVVTNYTQNSQNAPDPNRREACLVKTTSYKRWFDVTEFQLKYTGYKIGAYVDEPIPGQKIMTDELGQEIMIGTYKLLMNAGIVQNMEHYVETLVVEIDGANGKLKISEEPVYLGPHYQTEITSYPVAGQL